MDIYLVVIGLATGADGVARQVSVWVQAGSAAVAAPRARQALIDAGLQPVEIIDLTPTDEDDYFRECPSQQAFVRAQAEGIAWRYNDAGD